MKKYVLLALLFFSLIPSNCFSTIDNDKARYLIIGSGIAAMIIGNQDRSTQSGDILKYGGLALAFFWTF